jgi:serine/threonine protein kinase
MTSERSRFQRVESIFTELSATPPEDPGAIERRLIELAEGDQSIIDEVSAMLDLDRTQSNILDQPAIEIDPREFDDHDLPDSIGRYTITGVLGEGGMGIVYEAQQQSTNRRVALKVIRTRSIQDKIKRRFQREAEILAKLNHPGIATIYESGTTEDNRTPFVAMELVEGVPIHHFCRDQATSIEQRVQLLIKVCRAVAYAHSIGIVHRDLKPGNILVTEQSEPKVLDFGIALDLELDERTMISQTGQLLGTLQYMAPEQVDRSAKESSTTTDVYALGLIAFEILTGKSAHAGRDSSMYELVRSIRDDDPDTLGTHDRALRGDLETIVAKALAREPERRYPEAGALADDLERFLSNKPIEARPPSTWYQLRKFSQRNPLLVGSVAAIMLVLVVAIVLISNALRIANQERTIAQQQQHAQELTARFVTEDLFAAGNPDFDGDASISLLDAMRDASDKIPQRFEGAPEAEAAISFTMGDQFRLMNDFEKAEKHLLRSVELSKDLPDLHIDLLLNRYNSLIDLYNDIDDLDTALALVQEAEDLMATHPELSDTIRIDTLVQHASLLYYTRDMDQSAEIFQRAVDLGEKSAPEYNGTVDAATALAMVYTNLKRYDEARAMHKKGIEMRINTLGPEHPATLQAMDNYSIQLFRDGNHEEARSLLEDVLEIRLRVFGDEHHKTDLTRALIGRTMILEGNYEQAEPILLDAFDGLTETLGPDHRYTLVAKSLLHDLYTKWEKPELAANYTANPDGQP